MPRIPWPSPLSIGGKSVPYGLAVVLGAIGYFALARLGLAFATLQESASPVWPASGFALAVIIIAGPRTWPAIAIGAFAANLLTGGWVSASFITVGNTLECLAGFWIYSRIQAIGTSQLPIARSSALVLAALGASVVSAGMGVATFTIAGVLGEAEISKVFLTWWAGDVLGILLVTSAILAFIRAPLHLRSAAPTQAPASVSTTVLMLRRIGILALLVLTSSGVAFLLPGWSWTFLLAFPAMLLAARWFGDRGISLLLLLTAISWLFGTILGLGPFIDANFNDSLLNAQLMLATIAIAGLVLADVDYVRSAAATTVFLVGCLISGAIFVTQLDRNLAIDQRHLDNLAVRTQAHIVERMKSYVDALRGGASFYAASSNVTRAEWRAYVQSLGLAQNLPGLFGASVVVPVDKSSVAAFLASIRRDSARDFNITPLPNVPPQDAAYPEHFVIIYAEPIERNAGAIGIDIASEPRRREAAIAARDSGQPTLSARITLIQDAEQRPGFLLFVPMYREPPVNPTVVSLRWSFHGWIDAPFTAASFFAEALQGETNEIALRVFDGTKAVAEELMYDSQEAADRGINMPFRVELQTRLTLYGHEFTLQWARAALFDAQRTHIIILFCSGLLLFSALLAALVSTLLSQRERATVIASQMTAALTASNERFALAVACSRDGVWDYDVTTDQVWLSPRYKEMYGYDAGDTTDYWAFWNTIILPEDLARAQAQYDEMMAGTRDGIDMVQRYRHKMGHIVHVHSRALPVRDAAGKVSRVVGVHTDISLVVKLEQQLKAAINVMPDGFGLFDADDRVILFNKGFIDEGTRKAIGDPTGCRFEEIVRAFVDHDMPDAKDPAFDREAWIAQRMERHRNPPSEPIEVKWGGDRWMRISERRTADGGYVGTWTDVTEIKRLGQRLRDAIDALSDGFALFDADDRLVICNTGFITESMREVFGDPTGHTFEEIYRVFAASDPLMAQSVDRDRWLQERLLLHRNPPSQAYEFAGADGTRTRILEQRTAEGGWIGTWTDVTPEHRARQRLQDAISVMADGFALFDADDRLVICNDAYMHSPSLRDIGSLVGMNMEDILRRIAYAEITDIRAKVDADAWIADRLARHLNPTPEPYELLLTDGRVMHISERRTSDGGIVGVWSDVTALRVAERRLQDAIASINEGFVLLDAEGRYVVFNDEFLRLYPKTAPHVAVGASFEHTLRQGALAGEYPDLDTPAKVEAFVAQWIGVYRDPAAYQGEGQFADGRWVLIGHRGTTDGGCVNVYTDITAIKQRESDLTSAKARLENQAEELMAMTDDLKSARQAAEDASRSKSTFLADMSHELRTPLNGILGFSDIIRSEIFGKVEPDRYRDYAEDIHKSGAHLLQLINDLLDLSKIEANKMTLTIDAVSMTELVDHATRLVASLAQERGVTVSAPAQDICPVVHADERQMRQILLNLLSNAVKFTAAGGKVTVRAVEDGEHGIIISVTDTGVGMTEAELKKALERFGQVENNLVKSVPGTGLGLPLVAAITKLHGGRLDIASEKGKGTIVTVRLPWHGGLHRPI